MTNKGYNNCTPQNFVRAHRVPFLASGAHRVGELERGHLRQRLVAPHHGRVAHEHLQDPRQVEVADRVPSVFFFPSRALRRPESI